MLNPQDFQPKYYIKNYNMFDHGYTEYISRYKKDLDLKLSSYLNTKKAWCFYKLKKHANKDFLKKEKNDIN